MTDPELLSTPKVFKLALAAPSTEDAVAALRRSVELGQRVTSSFTEAVAQRLFEELRELLELFCEDLESLERGEPEKKRTTAKQRLGDREGAIAVARMIVFPGVGAQAGDDINYRSVAARNRGIMKFSGQPASGFRRIEFDRSGHTYWDSFLPLFIKFARARLAVPDAVDGRPVVLRASSSDSPLVQRLLDHSVRFYRELTVQIAGVKDDTADVRAQRLYVNRELEDKLVANLRSPSRSPQIVSGAAGYGKSSLIWGVARKLGRTSEVSVVLISATWLPTRDSPGLFALDDLVAAADELSSKHRSVVVLLDTADLLLHSEVSTELTKEFIDALHSLSVGVLATVRPVEAEELVRLGERQQLSEYSVAELHRATTALMAEFFPHHDPNDGILLVEEAFTRQLPVLEIMVSPLFLRLLFDLAGEVLPSMELDVTGLYERYWTMRIESDHRSARKNESRDLSSTALRAGIAMLAEGTPELQRSVLVDVIEQVKLSGQTISVSQDLDELTDRGVMILSEGRARFAHQTLFEYAAALGLWRRGGSKEASRFLEHLEQNPYDLFAGAVFEQLLLLMGRTNTGVLDLGSIVGQMMEQDSDNLAQSGLLVWAHHPEMDVPLNAVIRKLDVSHLSRFLEALPQVWNASGEAATAIEEIWDASGNDARGSVVRAMGRIAKRHPAAMVELFEKLDIGAAYLAASKGSQSNPHEYFNLLFALAAESPDLVRFEVLRVLNSWKTHEARARIVELTAVSWPELGSDDFATQLSQSLVASQDRLGDVIGRNIREALGALLFRHREIQRRNDVGEDELVRARGILAQVGVKQNSVLVGAELNALARYLGSLDEEGEPELQEMLDLVFAQSAADGPPRIVGDFLVPLFRHESPAAREAAARLGRVLQRGLPSPANSGGLTGEQKWAITARALLLDEQTPLPVVYQVCASLDPGSRSLWTSIDNLAAVTAPAAIAGVRGAQVALRNLALDFESMDAEATTKFLHAARRFLGVDRLVTDAYINATIGRQFSGSLLRAPSLPLAHDVMVTRASDLQTIAEELLAGNNNQARQGAYFWHQLQMGLVLSPTVAKVIGALENAKDPAARATLIRMLPRAMSGVEGEGEQALDAIHRFSRLAVERDLAAKNQRGKSAGFPPVIVDAAFDAWRAILASSASLKGWATLKELALQKPATGKQDADAGQMRDVSTFLRNLARAGQLDGAALCIADIGAAVSDQRYSPKQLRTISNMLRTPIVIFAQGANRDQLEVIVQALPSFPRVMGEITVRTFIPYPAGRELLTAALQRHSLGVHLAQYTLDLLRKQRDRASQPLPWIVRAAS